MSEDKARLAALLREKQERERVNQLSVYTPYEWQRKWMETSGGHAQRLLMAANRIGKTFTGARELAIHATGLYPEWWTGRRYTRPINAWACGKTNETTRDLVQGELLGPPDNPSELGTGAIPLACIGERTRKPQLPNALSSVLVRHTSGGWSRIGFKSYEMGHEKFMGYAQDCIWLDEEPDMQIFTQCITRTADRAGMLYMTFTPEAGMTEVVDMFMHDLKPGQVLQMAGWNDAPHITEAVKEQLLAVYPPHEREMRSKGIPIFGSGLVFPVHLLDDLTIDPISLPAHFPRICGLDFGWDHFTAAIWAAIDRENDQIYVYDEYFDRVQTPEYHALGIRARGHVPVSWPKDGLITEKGSGSQLATIYKNAGVNMLPFHFTNAPSATDPRGGVSVEAGVMELYQLMETRRIKIFRTCAHLIDQLRRYHRKDGKIEPVNDDLVAAFRYAVCARRHAKTLDQSSAWGMPLDRGQLKASIV